MREQLRDATGVDLPELAGTNASGEIPLSDTLLNRLIAERLPAKPAAVESVVIQSRPGNAFDVRVRPRSGWIPDLMVRVSILRQPDLPASPRLRLRWSLIGLGFLGRLASPVLSLVEVLPPGIHVEGDRAEVDLAELLRAQGHADVLPLVTRLEVSTEEGRFVVRFAVRI